MLVPVEDTGIPGPFTSDRTSEPSISYKSTGAVLLLLTLVRASAVGLDSDASRHASLTRTARLTQAAGQVDSTRMVLRMVLRQQASSPAAPSSSGRYAPAAVSGVGPWAPAASRSASSLTVSMRDKLDRIDYKNDGAKGLQCKL